MNIEEYELKSCKTCYKCLLSYTGTRPNISIQGLARVPAQKKDVKHWNFKLCIGFVRPKIVFLHLIFSMLRLYTQINNVHITNKEITFFSQISLFSMNISNFSFIYLTYLIGFPKVMKVLSYLVFPGDKDDGSKRRT